MQYFITSSNKFIRMLSINFLVQKNEIKPTLLLNHWYKLSLIRFLSNVPDPLYTVGEALQK